MEKGNSLVKNNKKTIPVLWKTTVGESLKTH